MRRVLPHLPGPSSVLVLVIVGFRPVILADTFAPGWSLTIDGAPAPIDRTNRLMRGAAVPARRHTLTYTYDPASFRIGGGVSLATVGLVAMAGLGRASGVVIRRRRGSGP
jgi:hypothetical protein